MDKQRRIQVLQFSTDELKNKKTKNDCYRQEGNMQILQRNIKRRLKWTNELHQHFVQAVDQLGGVYEATPKNIVKLMGVQEITSNHIKSHLQKYRHGKEFSKMASTKAAENGITFMPYEANQENNYSKTIARHTHEDIGMCKAQKLSIERQRNFQTKSEKSENFQQQMHCPQGKNLIAVLERTPETTKGQDKNSEEPKSKRDQLYEPVIHQTQIHSLGSCLTFCKVTENNQERHKVGAGADSDTQLALNEIGEKERQRQTRRLETDYTMWLAAIKKDRPHYSSLADRDGNVEEVEAKQKLANDSTINIGVQVTKANTSSRFLEGGQKNSAEYYDRVCDDIFPAQVEPIGIGVPNKSKLASFMENGPLYSSRESTCASNCQMFDLNVSLVDEPIGKE